jgi:type IX secretion system PorP/SprF family membrane protein
MKKYFASLTLIFLSISQILAQGLHFSQIPESPLLLNPSNAGLMPYDNYRVGVQYRNQWNTVPVDFNTIGAWGDLQIFRNKYETSWLGMGAAFYSDKAGDGILTLNQFQYNLAYHVLVNESSMFSGGVYGSYNQRSIDFSNMTFDLQWNGIGFDRHLQHQESYKYESTNYLDLGLGVNYAVFPSENFYAKMGLSVLHVNGPKESFYGNNNKLGRRPVLSIDMIAKASERWIISPVIYASFQKKASDILFGSLFAYNVSYNMKTPSIFSWGAYYRWNDAIIATLGYEFNKIKFLLSYDITSSAMSQANQMNGAIEFSIIYQGLYLKNSDRGMGGFNCPRF